MTFPFFETLVFSFFDVFQYYLITNKLNYGKISVVPRHFIGIVVFAISSAVGSVTIEGVNAYFINTVFFMLLSWWLYNKRRLQLLYFHIIGISLVLTIQLSIIFLMYIFLRGVDYTFTMGMIAQILGLILAILVSKFLPIQLLFKFVEARNDLFRVISLNLFILLSQVSH